MKNYFLKVKRIELIFLRDEKSNCLPGTFILCQYLILLKVIMEINIIIQTVLRILFFFLIEKSDLDLYLWIY